MPSKKTTAVKKKSAPKKKATVAKKTVKKKPAKKAVAPKKKAVAKKKTAKPKKKAEAASDDAEDDRGSYLDSMVLEKSTDNWLLRQYGNVMMTVGGWFVRRGMFYADMYVSDRSVSKRTRGGLNAIDVSVD